MKLKDVVELLAYVGAGFWLLVIFLIGLAVREIWRQL